ncbi:hypothetical protein BACCIP111883_04554 [Sutcliffiella rhizosphaerae]|uniref:Uncharacterized protein n=1 Tax=Sutcliffiella rhizosphaerae TaxID=2880967 RepID=A0ABN8AJI9_9BACI|nr:hypothetical protein BACCIP111883_04554 [Sutcliffiella rhizosphaerae]
MNLLLLVFSIFLLLFSMTKLAKIKYSKNDSILKEARSNLISLLWGGVAIAGYLLTTYQVWV